MAEKYGKSHQKFRPKLDAPTKKDLSVGKALAQAILLNRRLTHEQDRPFVKLLQAQARKGTINPSTLRLLWEAAFGFPEKTEALPVGDVRIVHQYQSPPK